MRSAIVIKVPAGAPADFQPFPRVVLGVFRACRESHGFERRAESMNSVGISKAIILSVALVSAGLVGGCARQEGAGHTSQTASQGRRLLATPPTGNE